MHCYIFCEIVVFSFDNLQLNLSQPINFMLNPYLLKGKILDVATQK